ncbi:C4-type zinc ribbon domain-containing protein [Gordonia sp. CPCC 206044]|uniref:zinc ribbon domain-containing protein n=1 Tax=Gordonia sp. CPCC 206044 TaxID=3140793 RepID=UPI003AF3E0FF
MKVDAGIQRRLLDLADADAELARLAHRSTHLPEDAELAELAEKVDVARDDQVRAEISAEDLAREYQRIDGEVTGMSAREAKDSAQLTAGGLAPKALSELQHELTSLTRRRSGLEEDLLAIMEQQEAVSGEQQRAAATVDHLNAEITATSERRAAELERIEADRIVAAERRDELAADIVPELLAVYDRQRAAGKIGAGLLRARRCGACRMELDRGTIAAIAAKQPDDVVRCEECGAVLVRTTESGLP